MIWARCTGVMGAPMECEMAKILVVGTGASPVCADAGTIDRPAASKDAAMKFVRMKISHRWYLRAYTPKEIYCVPERAASPAVRNLESTAAAIRGDAWIGKPRARRQFSRL